MNRYVKLLMAVVITSVLAAVGIGTSQAASKPNIVFILSDDHSAPFVGCYGYPIKTPNLDQFAAEGMRFDRMFTAAPQCVQSRAAMMTGRSAVSARIARFTSPLPPDVPTLPGLLKANGYYTGVCRRIYHLDSNDKTNTPYAAILDKHNLRRFKDNFDYVKTGGRGVKETIQQVNAFFDGADKSKPFFLWVNFGDPHHPWDDNAVAVGNDPNAIQMPPYLPDLPSVRKDLARYCDEISRMDGEFQAVLDILKSRGLGSDTIVMFMGDNGLAFPHGKGGLYDPGLNVPLIVRWPGVVKGGSITSQMISGEDITPTLLDIVGIKTPAVMRGVSFAQLLKGQPFKGRTHLFAERGIHGSATFNEYTPVSSGIDLARCVRTDRYKLIFNFTPHNIYQPVDSFSLPYWKEMKQLADEGKLEQKFVKAYFTNPRPIWELYDLAADPAELNNLYDNPKYKDTALELQTVLMENMTLNYDFLPLPM